MGMKSLEQYCVDFNDVIKAQLGAAIRAKGGTVNDTDAWSAFVSAINAISLGKKFASGSTTSSSETLNFYGSVDNVARTRNYITITGLSFTPSYILILKGDNTEQISYDISRGTQYAIDVVTNRNGTFAQATCYVFKLDGTSAYTNASGFQMPVQTATATYNWVAIA